MIHYILAAALIAGQATAAPERCLTREEAGDIALTAVPIALGALTERCRAHVPATAFLNTGAPEMLARLRAAAEPRRASAFAAFARMSRPTTPPATDGEEAAESEAPAEAGDGQAEEEGSAIPSFDFTGNPVVMEGFVTVMAAALASSMDTAACADANVLVESLSPLSPENIARLAGAGLGIAGTARPDATDNPLCPA